jgi:glycosyltransferase involved in cell wall biosynthesis
LIITLLVAVMMGIRVYLISEPYSPISAGYQTDHKKLINWAKALLRPYIYHFYGVLLGRRIAGVFAISTLAISQYQSIGITRKKIFPFGYFVPRSESLSERPPVIASKKTGLNLIFIGTLIKRKGLDVLINAVKNLNREQLVVTLDIYGPGDPGQFDIDQSCVRYCGSIPFGEAQTVISKYDLLVVPSRYDGWGVVVNEALMTGVPVICSNRVGAGAIIGKWQCGSIFTSENESDLERKLTDIIVAPEALANMRLAARKVSAVLDPELAGHYMCEVLSQNSSVSKQIIPSCPWYDGTN